MKPPLNRLEVIGILFLPPLSPLNQTQEVKRIKEMIANWRISCLLNKLSPSEKMENYREDMTSQSKPDVKKFVGFGILMCILMLRVSRVEAEFMYSC